MVAVNTRRSTVRQNTPARWAAALARAQAKGIAIVQHSTSGVFFATSSDKLDLYRVRWYDCECEAGRSGDPVCLHRAAFREHCRQEDMQTAKMLAGDYVDPELDGIDVDALMAEPTIPYDAALVDRLLDGGTPTFDEAAAREGTTVLSVAAGSGTVETLTARAMCTDCLDTGTARMYTGGRGNEWVPVTCGCQRRAA